MRTMGRKMLICIIAISFTCFYTTLSTGITNAQRSGWGIRTVDSTGDVGQFTSLDLDSNGYPHISYYDSTNRDLKYAKWTGSSWQITTVDSAGDVGTFTSIAVDSYGNPHISYRDQTNGDLKYATLTGGAWTISTVDSTGDVGEYASIALDANGHVHISYYYWDNGDLKYATNASGQWVTTTVDSGGNVGGDTSIAIDDSGYPHVSYYDITYGNLKYAKWNGSVWQITPIDSTGDVGRETSIALDPSGYPHISYRDATNGDLKYATNASGQWVTTTVDSAWYTGAESSIAIDASGYPHISYYHVEPSDLRYARWDGGSWQITTVDSTDDVGDYTSIALDSDGNPYISYYSYTGQDLKFVSYDSISPGSPTLSSPSNGSFTSNNTPTFDWSDVGDLSGVTYDFQVDDNSDFSSPTISKSGLISSTYTVSSDEALAVGSYYWRVRAVDGVGNQGGWSSPTWSFNITPPPTVPTAPTGLTATPGDSQVTLTWQAPASDGGSAITNYKIYRGTTSGGQGSTPIAEPTGASYQDTDVTNGVTYYYQVSAVNAVGEGPRSNEASATPTAIPNQPPSIPSLSSPPNGSSTNDNTSKLTWDIPVDVDGDALHFKVEIATDSDFTSPITGSPFESKISTVGFSPAPPVTQGTGTCSYTLQSVLSDGTYYWRVQAWDGTTYSNPPTAWSFIIDTMPPSIENFIVFPDPFSPDADGENDNTTITADFSEFVSLSLEIIDNEGNTVTSSSGSGTSLSYMWDGKYENGQVVPNSTYSIEVTATDEAGNENSAEENVTVSYTPKAPTITIEVTPDLAAGVIRVTVTSDENLLDLLVRIKLPDNTIDNVEMLYVGEIWVRERMFKWEGSYPIAQAGTYTVTADSVDMFGSTSSTAAPSIEVTLEGMNFVLAAMLVVVSVGAVGAGVYLWRRWGRRRKPRKVSATKEYLAELKKRLKEWEKGEKEK